MKKLGSKIRLETPEDRAKFVSQYKEGGYVVKTPHNGTMICQIGINKDLTIKRDNAADPGLYDCVVYNQRGYIKYAYTEAKSAE